MTTIGIHEAKHRLLHYLTCAAAGEEILITRRGKAHSPLGPTSYHNATPKA